MSSILHNTHKLLAGVLILLGLMISTPFLGAAQVKIPSPCSESVEPTVNEYLNSLPGFTDDFPNRAKVAELLNLIVVDCQRLEVGHPSITRLIAELNKAISTIKVKPAAGAEDFGGFLITPALATDMATNTETTTYFPGPDGGVAILENKESLERENPFLTRWWAAKVLLCAMTDDKVQQDVAYQSAFKERRDFIRNNGFVQYPWEYLVNKDPDRENYWVLLHPSLAFALGPVEGKTFRQLNEASKTSIEPCLNVALVGFIYYPLDKPGDKQYDSYKRYRGLTLGIMSGPRTSNRPQWGPSIEVHFMSYSLGVSRHRTEHGPNETYLFTTFNLAKYLKSTPGN